MDSFFDDDECAGCNEYQREVDTLQQAIYHMVEDVQDMIRRSTLDVGAANAAFLEERLLPRLMKRVPSYVL